jgi:5-hydroxyisourate hydrolase-like protein (transthyretin family)
MIGSLEIVLVAVMIGKNNFTGTYELQYQPLDYYKSMSSCNAEKTRLQKKPEKGITYICLKVDYD